MDEGSYMNDGGSRAANCGGSKSTSLRWIDKGEHLTENYASYVDLEGRVEWFHRLRSGLFGSGTYVEQGAPLSKQPIQGQQPAEAIVSAPAISTIDEVMPCMFGKADLLLVSLLTWLAVILIAKRRLLYVGRKTKHGL